MLVSYLNQVGVVTQAIALGASISCLPIGHVEQELKKALFVAVQWYWVFVYDKYRKWEKETYNLASQAQRMRTWLSQTDDKIMMKIGPYLPLSIRGESLIYCASN